MNGTPRSEAMAASRSAMPSRGLAFDHAGARDQKKRRLRSGSDITDGKAVQEIRQNERAFPTRANSVCVFRHVFNFEFAGRPRWTTRIFQ